MRQKSLFWLLTCILTVGCTSSSPIDNYVDFLYKNMSLPDSVDYTRDYYVEQTRVAMQARAELPWGRMVPEREFCHFVLPPRVSNEDLDHFRATYYEELRNLVCQVSMQEAILEINHWCHEHVTYRPTSARTLGPESTIRTAYGRCGEESVLLVAALRTVSIPARQVYTPRWAHTDDNHAWVEAWADGQWCFLGACEPEPVLNLGWFNESASRGMLMHTKVFGNYDGPEEVVSHQPGLTEINVTGNYAPTRRLTVTVLDSLSNPVPHATVEFKLYNYAEFYTVASKQTDAEGHASLTAGLGDMLIWATASPSLLAFQKVSFATDSIVTLHLQERSSLNSKPLTLNPIPSARLEETLDTSRTLNSKPLTLNPQPSARLEETLDSSRTLNPKLSTQTYDLTPPPASVALPEVSPEQREENTRRLAIEDSIRHAYESTMPDQRSRGNHTVIAAFLDSAAALGQQDLAKQLIEVLPDKDLQDITIDVLLDNLPTLNPNLSTLNPPSTLSPQPSTKPSPPRGESERGLTLSPQPSTLNPYLLSPRIERERLTPFKAPLRAAFTGFDVNRLITWTRDSICIVEGRNPQHLRMTPLGVYHSRIADRLGRDIFFVAACRSLGIPARINEINGKVQYFAPSASPSPSSAFTWNDVTFEPIEPTVSQVSIEGDLRLTYTPSPYLPDAKYYTHFTLSRLDKTGHLQLLTYPEEATFHNTFADGVTLDAGTYFLTTGVRMADGSVRAILQAFDIQPGTTTTIPLTLRTATDAVSVIGSLNAENLYQPLNPQLSAQRPATHEPSGTHDSPLGLATSLNEAPTSLLSTTGRGYYALGLIAPNQEPTNHALRDIILVSKDLEQWNRKLVLLFEDTDAAARFNFKEFSGLPSTTVWGTDIDGTIQQEIIEQMHLTNASLPIFLICDSFNRVVFIQQGYTIGLGEQLLKVIHQL